MRHAFWPQWLVLAVLLGACGEPAPNVETSVWPSTGDIGGGAVVTVSAPGARADAAILFGGRLAPQINALEPGRFHVVTPPMAAGTVDVTVMHGAQTFVTLRDAFTYKGEQELRLHSVEPASAPATGGNVVIVRGAGFEAEGLEVLFGNTPSPSVQVLSPLVVHAEVPPGEVGSHTLWVRAGTSSDSLVEGWQYAASAMEITAVRPARGPSTGGTTVELLGGGFLPETQVFFGPVRAQRVTFLTAERMQVTAPEGVAGTVDVVVRNPEGSATSAGAFVYEAGALTLSGLSPLAGAVAGGTEVTLSGTGFGADLSVTIGGRTATVTRVLGQSKAQIITPSGSAGPAAVVAQSQGQTAHLEAGFTYARSDAVGGTADDHPYVVSARAINSVTVEVTFSESMVAYSNPANFTIRGPGIASVSVEQISLVRPSYRTILLQTRPMSQLEYTVTVHRLTSAAGVPLAEPVITPDGILHHNQATFRGRPESPDDTTRFDCDGAATAYSPPVGTLTDCDGDGVTDADEEAGYQIRITRLNGTVDVLDVAGSPEHADTDGDGVDDATEYVEGMNPRSGDTDNDTISDFDELAVLMSSAASQDTDGDGLGDATERFYHTSLLLADSDGDQFNDYSEIIERGRNPRVADLPRPRVLVGGINLQVDHRYTYTDAEGVERTEERSAETSLESGRASAYTTADSTTVAATLEVAAGAEFAGPMVMLSSSLTAGVAYEHNWSTESTQVSSSTRAFNDAITMASSFSESSDVAREVAGASVSVAVSFRNQGDVSFTLRNIELTLLKTDSLRPDRTVPVASLRAANPDLEINLGPLFPESGPYIFTSSEVFPSQVEELMANPTSALVRVANYDVLDEEGRNLAFVAERVAEVAGSLVIDYGDGTVEKFEVAAHSEFDADTGRPLGLRLTEVLKTVGLEPLGGCIELCPYQRYGVADSPHCSADRPHCIGVRCRPSCETDADCGRDEGCFSGAHYGAGSGTGFTGTTCMPLCDVYGECLEGSGCRDTPNGHGGGTRKACRTSSNWNAARWATQRCAIRYSQSTTPVFAQSYSATPGAGGLHLSRVREIEATYLTTWPEPELADDDLPSPLGESKRLWMIYDGTAGFRPGTGTFEPTSDITNIFLRPGRTILLAHTRDQDGDGLSEIEELAAGSLDTKVDSDGDGLEDWREIRGSLPKRRAWPAEAWYPVGCPDIGDNPQPHQSCEWRVHTDRRIGGYVTRSLPFDADSDDDGLTDLEEAETKRYGNNPNNFISPTDPLKADTDEDGLSDREETQPRTIRLRYNGTEVEVTTNPLAADSDSDGISDRLELIAGLNPTVADAQHFSDDDGDGVNAAREAGGWRICIGGLRRPDPQGGWICGTGATARIVTASDGDNDADDDGLSDFVEFSLGTDPSNADTDGDGLSDRDEWDHTTLLDTFAADCALFRGCTLPNPEDSLLIGTLPWSSDTDGDGLGDGQEVRGWTVDFRGPHRDGVMPPIHVNSDPTTADTDFDGLDDGTEFRYTGGSLNPRNGDTDGDGLGDAVEESHVDDEGIARHPLRPDSRVMVRLAAQEARLKSDKRWMAAELHLEMERGAVLLSAADEMAEALQLSDDIPMYRGPAGCDGYPYSQWPTRATSLRYDGQYGWRTRVVTLGFDEQVSVRGYVELVGESDEAPNCDTAYDFYTFGGEGIAPPTTVFDGTLSVPLSIAFDDEAFRPPCRGNSCGFEGSFIIQAEPYLDLLEEVNCTDGRDGDGDGHVDCEDWDCGLTDACFLSPRRINKINSVFTLKGGLSQSQADDFDRPELTCGTIIGPPSPSRCSRFERIWGIPPRSRPPATRSCGSMPTTSSLTVPVRWTAACRAGTPQGLPIRA
jgi:hypothetical protein